MSLNRLPADAAANAAHCGIALPDIMN